MKKTMNSNERINEKKKTNNNTNKMNRMEKKEY